MGLQKSRRLSLRFDVAGTPKESTLSKYWSPEYSVHQLSQARRFAITPGVFFLEFLAVFQALEEAFRQCRFQGKRFGPSYRTCETHGT